MKRNELNIAINGVHWARVILPESYAQDDLAKAKARVIDRIIRAEVATWDHASTVKTRLTQWVDSGVEVDFTT